MTANEQNNAIVLAMVAASEWVFGHGFYKRQLNDDGTVTLSYLTVGEGRELLNAKI